jgi:hypothetical protein
MEDTNMGTKQAANANSTATSTSTNTPGAAHVDVPVSSMKGKQAFQQTNLTSGPLYYPEDEDQQHQQLAARRLEQESAVSSERADAKSCSEKTEAKLKQEGKSKKQTLRDEKLKRAARSDREIIERNESWLGPQGRLQSDQQKVSLQAKTQNKTTQIMQ